MPSTSATKRRPEPPAPRPPRRPVRVHFVLPAERFATRRNLLLLAGVVLLLGSAFFAWISLRAPRGIAPGAGYQTSVNTALQYVQEMQAGKYEQALFRVAWVQERLARVRSASGDAEAESKELRTLAAEQAPGDRSRAVLEKEGIEDSYIFVPRAEITVAGADGGRVGLERPTAGRAWLSVSYPDPSNAPKNDTGRPIRGLTVGLNMSEDGYVLKADIVGNLEIDRFSIRYF